MSLQFYDEEYKIPKRSQEGTSAPRKRRPWIEYGPSSSFYISEPEAPSSVNSQPASSSTADVTVEKQHPEDVTPAMNDSPEDVAPAMNHSPEDVASIVRSSITTQPDIAPSSHQKLCLPTNDWIVDIATRDNNSQSLYSKNLTFGSFFKIHLTPNGIRIHLRVYKPVNNFDYVPTVDGVTMTPATFYEFSQKMSWFNVKNKYASTIANNQLLIIYHDDQMHLKQMFNADGNFKIKPSTYCADMETVNKIQYALSDVSKEVIKCLIYVYIPHVIEKAKFNGAKCKNTNCFLNGDEAKIGYFAAICCELLKVSEELYFCEGCAVDNCSQKRHTCGSTIPLMKYLTVSEKVDFCINTKRLLTKLMDSCCICYLSVDFFKNNTIHEYENYKQSYFTL